LVPTETDKSVGDWRLAQIRGRTIESVMGIAVANYPAPQYDGRSLAVDPVGRMITLADPAIVLTEFDLAAIRAARRVEHFRWQQGNNSR
jgi:predicted amidohydrolase